MTQKKEVKGQAKRVEVTLKKPHTHAGKEYAEGDKITITTSQADWLKKRGVV